jgi:hypothetical protein
LIRHLALRLMVCGVFLLGCSFQLRPGRCQQNSDCPNGLVCSQELTAGVWHRCVSPNPDSGVETAPGCTAATCMNPNAPVCDSDAGRCVQCLQSTDCAAPTAVCDTSTSTCVGCLMDNDCSGTTPICEAKTCRACKADAECVTKLGADPGVCMAHQDGRCAVPSETIYVQNDIARCSDTDPNAGVVARPLCSMQPVPTFLSTTRPLVVVRGTVQGGSWMYMNQVAAEMSVVGQQSALIGSVTSPAFSMQSGSVYIRGVKFSPSASIGIKATGGTLRLDTVTVDSCMAGGILLDGAAFDIRNATVTNNGPAQQGTTFWGGILVNSVPPSGQTRLDLVTIENNRAPGLLCVAAIQGDGVFASGNSTSDIGSMCGITPCPSANSTCGAQ